MRVVAIIQARMGSSRLPGKVLLDLRGHSVLEHVITRCNYIEKVNDVIVATTVKSMDDSIELEASKLGIACYRGSEEDVLDRYYEAAKKSKADIVVRITSDCPLIDPQVSNEVITKFLSNNTLDYCSNSLVRCFPRGLDTEVYSFSALEKAHYNSVMPYEREHVTPYIYQHPEEFSLGTVTSTKDYSHYRWTLDTVEDLLLIREIYNHLYKPGEIFSWKTILELMESRPELAEINAHIEQKKLNQL